MHVERLASVREAEPVTVTSVIKIVDRTKASSLTRNCFLSQKYVLVWMRRTSQSQRNDLLSTFWDPLSAATLSLVCILIFVTN